MAAFSKVSLLFVLTIALFVLAKPLVLPESLNITALDSSFAPSTGLRKRKNNKRCHVPSSSTDSSSSPSSGAIANVAPEPTPSNNAPSSIPAASNGNEPSYLQGTQTGQGTWYDIGLGACGISNSGDDRIAAVSHLLYDSYPGYTGSNPNDNPVCGRTVTAHYQGKSTTVKIEDRCTGCALTDLDFSPRAFEDLADPSIGRLDGVTWEWDS